MSPAGPANRGDSKRVRGTQDLSVLSVLNSPGCNIFHARIPTGFLVTLWAAWQASARSGFCTQLELHRSGSLGLEAYPLAQCSTVGKMEAVPVLCKPPGDSKHPFHTKTKCKSAKKSPQSPSSPLQDMPQCLPKYNLLTPSSMYQKRIHIGCQCYWWDFSLFYSIQISESLGCFESLVLNSSRIYFLTDLKEKLFAFLVSQHGAAWKVTTSTPPS